MHDVGNPLAPSLRRLAPEEFRPLCPELELFKPLVPDILVHPPPWSKIYAKVPFEGEFFETFSADVSAHLASPVPVVCHNVVFPASDFKGDGCAKQTA